MAFDNTIELTAGAEDVNFTLISRAGMSSLYADQDSTSTSRAELLIRHQKSGKPGKNTLIQPWRRNVQLNLKEYDATNAVTEALALNFTISGTPGNVITSADAERARQLLLSFLTEANFGRILVGES